MDYVYPYREKGRPRSKPDHNLKYLNSSEIVYETEEQMESYELDEEQVSSLVLIVGSWTTLEEDYILTWGPVLKPV